MIMQDMENKFKRNETKTTNTNNKTVYATAVAKSNFMFSVFHVQKPAGSKTRAN